MATSLPQPQLDHIVIHLPPQLLDNPPTSLETAFRIIPGGYHGDNVTRNALVCFVDGTYLELLAFTDPTPPSSHFWAGKGYGIIDYAFTLAGGSADFSSLQSQWADLDLPAGWKPGPLTKDSRIKGDGSRIEWEVAFPDRSVRGCAPFWCFDVTPRELRVPSSEEATTHPCGAKGVGDLLVFLDEERRAPLKSLLGAIMPPAAAVSSESSNANGDDSDGYTWDLATPRKVEAGVPCSLSLMLSPQTQTQRSGQGESGAVDGGRNLVARLLVLTDGSDERIGLRNIKETVEGDELSIGFVTC